MMGGKSVEASMPMPPPPPPPSSTKSMSKKKVSTTAANAAGALPGMGVAMAQPTSSAQAAHAPAAAAAAAPRPEKKSSKKKDGGGSESVMVPPPPAATYTLMNPEEGKRTKRMGGGKGGKGGGGAPSAAGGGRKRVESWCNYIIALKNAELRAREEVENKGPLKCTMAEGAMQSICAATNHLLDQFIGMIRELQESSSTTTVQTRTIHMAAKFILQPDRSNLSLYEIAQGLANDAMKRYKDSAAASRESSAAAAGGGGGGVSADGKKLKKKAQNRSKRAGLVWPVGRTERILKQHFPRMSALTGVCVSAYMEATIRMLLEDCTEATLENGKTKMQRRHVFLAITPETTLKGIFFGHIFKGGVLQNIQPALFPPSRRSVVEADDHSSSSSSSSLVS